MTNHCGLLSRNTLLLRLLGELFISKRGERVHIIWLTHPYDVFLSLAIHGYRGLPAIISRERGITLPLVRVLLLCPSTMSLGLCALTVFAQPSELAEFQLSEGTDLIKNIHDHRDLAKVSYEFLSSGRLTLFLHGLVAWDCVET